MPVLPFDESLADLPPENVFGHTHKVVLFRRACAALRAQRGGLRILDVGCGSGYAVTRFLGAPDDNVTGIDLFAPNIEYARRQFERKGLRFELRTAASLSEMHDRFDAVVLADVLEHLDEPAQLLADCRRLLAPGGRLLLTVPNGHGPFEIESALSRVPILGWISMKLVSGVVRMLDRYGPLKGKWTRTYGLTPADLPYNLESGHVQFFTLRVLERLLRESGF
jgi:2-polyprenyl-3-methyl-5-hydroxy-6-metoxy-1,4-benzoquinol methylase